MDILQLVLAFCHQKACQTEIFTLVFKKSYILMIYILKPFCKIQ